MTRSIELIARAVIAVDGWVLLVRKKGRTSTFLPGGHVDVGEPAEVALARELQEELGRAVEVGRFLGAVENAWTDTGGTFHELNLVFAATFPGAAPGTVPPSEEAHLEFLWGGIDQLDRQNLLPSVLHTLVPEWVRDRRASGWASTLKIS